MFYNVRQCDEESQELQEAIKKGAKMPFTPNGVECTFDALFVALYVVDMGGTIVFTRSID